MEREVIREVVKEASVPQVRAAYPYAGSQGLHIAKGEVSKQHILLTFKGKAR